MYSMISQIVNDNKNAYLFHYAKINEKLNYKIHFCDRLKCPLNLRAYKASKNKQ